MNRIAIISILGCLGAGCGGAGTAPDGGGVTTKATLSVVTAGGGKVTASSVGLDCGAACSVEVTTGTVVTLTATAAANQTLSGWAGACSGTSSTCTVTVNEDTSVTANFALSTRAVEVVISGAGSGSVVTTPGGATCPGACSARVAHGTQLTFTATADATSRFIGWTGGSCTGTAACTLSVTDETLIEAQFALAQTLTVTRSGNAGTAGTVTSNPEGIACGSDCEERYLSGGIVTLTATAGPNSEFTGWSGEGCTGTSTCEVLLNTARNVDAAFTLLKRTLTTSTTGTGTITSDLPGIDCGTDCMEAFDHGALVTLTAAAGTAHQFTAWGGDCSGTGACVVTMDRVRNVTATFTPLSGLTVTRAGDAASLGSVSSTAAGISCGSDCSEPFLPGTQVELTAVAPSGTTFDGWSGGGCATANPCTLTMPNGSAAVTATFSLRQYTLSVVASGSGSVSSSPAGITCNGDCSESFRYTTPITLTALPDTGETFQSWSGGGCGTTNPCTLTMPAAATTVIATFSGTIYDTIISSSPPATTTSTSATFVFASVPAGASSFQCALDGAVFSSCSSPLSYSGLGSTYHQFRVRVVGDPTAASFSWQITGGTPPRLPDSFSALCTDGAALVACPAASPAGQDGAYRINVPVYTAATGTVTDSVTGLMWERNPGGPLTHGGAVGYCDALDLGTFSDWRMPTRYELFTIVDAQRLGGSWEPVAFPPVAPGSLFWTSTLVANSSGDRWTIAGDFPLLVPLTESTPMVVVRCVRLSQGGGALINYSANTVLDGRSGLYWQKATIAPSTWQQALAACEASTSDGFSDWRLPSQKELISIVDDTQANPAISALFTERQAEPFWTSSVVPGMPTESLAVDFAMGDNGNINNPHTELFRSRCVR